MGDAEAGSLADERYDGAENPARNRAGQRPNNLHPTCPAAHAATEGFPGAGADLPATRDRQRVGGTGHARNWKLTVSHRVAGKDLDVAVAIDVPRRAIVITVF